MRIAAGASLFLLAAMTPSCGQTSADPVTHDTARTGQPITIATERAFALVNVDGTLFQPDNYAFNGATSNPLSVTHPATGHYRVSFVSSGTGFGNAQVNAFGQGSSRCNLSGWGPSGEGVIALDVLCFQGETPADSGFVAFYDNDMRRGASGRGGAFLLNVNGSASGVANAATSFNSSGAVNSIQRTGTGTYSVHLPNLTDASGNVQVTAVGTSANFCAATGWLKQGSDVVVGVLCWNPTGQLADSAFSLRYSVHDPAGDQDSRAFAVLDKPNQTSFLSYTPAPALQANDLAQDTALGSAVRFSTGIYRLTIPQMPGTVWATGVVTAINNATPRYCKEVGWAAAPLGSGTHVDINCYDASGNFADTQVSDLFIQHQPVCFDHYCQDPERLVHPGANRGEDNPQLFGYVAQERFTSISLKNSWDFIQNGFPMADSDEAYGGSAGLVLVSGTPVFPLPFQKSTAVLVHPSGTGSSATTFLPQYTTRMPPWVFFDNTCLPPCPQAPGVASFFGSAVNLPRDHSPVQIDMRLEQGNGATPDTVVNSISLKLDPAVRLIAVHFYVLLDSAGHIPASYGSDFADQATAIETLRRYVDFGFANNPTPATSRNTSRRTITEQASLLGTPDADPIALLAAHSDGPFLANCGPQVQFRLESVTFVRQSLGWEKSLYTDAEANSNTGEPNACAMAAAPFAQSLVASAEQAGLRQGFHVILGGPFGVSATNNQAGSPCQSGRFAFVSAGGVAAQSPRQFDPLTTTHELGHLLNLGDNAVFGNLMGQGALTGTTMTFAQCQIVAQKLALQPTL